MSDLKTMIDAQLMVLESVAERLARTPGRTWAVHEIDAAVAGIKSALDRATEERCPCCDFRPEHGHFEGCRLATAAPTSASEEGRRAVENLAEEMEMIHGGRESCYGCGVIYGGEHEDSCASIRDLAAAKRYARPAAPALAPERERLYRAWIDFLHEDSDGVYVFAFAHGWKGNEIAGRTADEFAAALGRNPDGTWREP